MGPRKQNPSYVKSMLDAAIKAVMSGKYTTKEASTVYGVPATTIGKNLKKGSTGKRAREPLNVARVDEQLLEWLKLMAEIGCVTLKNQMGDIVNELFERNGHRDRIMANSLQIQWTERFMQRNPDIPEEQLLAEYFCTGIGASHIEEWAQKLQKHFLITYNIEIHKFSVEENSSKIFACFEVGSIFRTADRKSTRLIYKPSQSQVDGAFMMSLYCCVCADGTFLKPVAIVKNAVVSQTSMETDMKSFHIITNSEGQMNWEAAMFWLQLIDVEIQSKVGRIPVLIYLDQSIRPLSLATIDFCRQQKQMLFYLPGHYPNMKLPFGMDVFYNLNGEYDNLLSCDDAKFNEANIDTTLKLLTDAWKLMLNTNSSITEFLDFGLVPHDVGAMKSTVEAIVPLTRSPNEEAFEPHDSAQTPGSSAYVPPTPKQDRSLASNATDTSSRSLVKDTAPIVHRRPTRIPTKNYKEVSDVEDSMDNTSGTSQKNCSTEKNVICESRKKKPNLKLKIKRSERIANNYSIDQDLNNRKIKETLSTIHQCPEITKNNRTVGACNKCDISLNNGLRAGVIQGLVFALKRIESSLRADTLSMFKSRYLSPYLSDHRPTEPSFVMWCEIMKCLEMGPDAVNQDFLLAQTLQEKSNQNHKVNQESLMNLSSAQANVQPDKNESLFIHPNNLLHHYASLQDSSMNARGSSNKEHMPNDLNIIKREEMLSQHNVCNKFVSLSKPNISDIDSTRLNEKISPLVGESSCNMAPNHPHVVTHQLISNLQSHRDTTIRTESMNPILASEERKPPAPLYHQVHMNARNAKEHKISHYPHDIANLPNNLIASTMEPAHNMARPIYSVVDYTRPQETFPMEVRMARQVALPNTNIYELSRPCDTELNNNQKFIYRDELRRPNTVDNKSTAQNAIGTISYQGTTIDCKQNFSEDNLFQPPNSLSKNFTSTPKPSLNQMIKCQAAPASQVHSSGKIFAHDNSTIYNYSDAHISNLGRHPSTSTQSYHENRMPLMEAGASHFPSHLQRASHFGANSQKTSEEILHCSNQSENLTDSQSTDVRRSRNVVPFQNYVSVQQTGEPCTVSYVSNLSYSQFTSDNVPLQMNFPSSHQISQVDQCNRGNQNLQPAYGVDSAAYQSVQNYLQPLQPMSENSVSAAGSSITGASDGLNVAQPEL